MVRSSSVRWVWLEVAQTSGRLGDQDGYGRRHVATDQLDAVDPRLRLDRPHGVVTVEGLLGLGVAVEGQSPHAAGADGRDDDVEHGESLVAIPVWMLGRVNRGNAPPACGQAAAVSLSSA